MSDSRPVAARFAFASGFVSVGSFVAPAWWVGSYNDQIARVVAADIVALVFLLVGAYIHLQGQG